MNRLLRLFGRAVVAHLVASYLFFPLFLLLLVGNGNEAGGRVLHNPVTRERFSQMAMAAPVAAPAVLTKWVSAMPIALYAALFVAACVLLPRRGTRAGRRIARGLCASCGYDLRATPRRCPECGTIPAATKDTR